MFCPHCGKYVTDSSKDCAYCGRPLDVSSVKSNVSPAPSIKNEVSSAVGGVNSGAVYRGLSVRKRINGNILCYILGVIGGFISIILGLVVSGMSIGSYRSSITYNGDAYTGIQNAAAQTANNVQDVADILNTGISSLLVVLGIAMIAYFGLKYFKNKENN